MTISTLPPLARPVTFDRITAVSDAPPRVAAPPCREPAPERSGWQAIEVAFSVGALAVFGLLVGLSAWMIARALGV